MSWNFRRELPRYESNWAGRIDRSIRPKVADMQKIKVEALKKTEEMKYSDRSLVGGAIAH